jgi:hypothetical protein
MTALVFNSGRFTVMTESWTATEYNSFADASMNTSIEVHVMGKLVDCARIEITMGEFIQLIAEGGKIVDLRKLQEPR